MDLKNGLLSNTITFYDDQWGKAKLGLLSRCKHTHSRCLRCTTTLAESATANYTQTSYRQHKPTPNMLIHLLVVDFGAHQTPHVCLGPAEGQTCNIMADGNVSSRTSHLDAHWKQWRCLRRKVSDCLIHDFVMIKSRSAFSPFLGFQNFYSIHWLCFDSKNVESQSEVYCHHTVSGHDVLCP